MLKLLYFIQIRMLSITIKDHQTVKNIRSRSSVIIIRKLALLKS